MLIPTQTERTPGICHMGKMTGHTAQQGWQEGEMLALFGAGEAVKRIILFVKAVFQCSIIPSGSTNW